MGNLAVKLGFEQLSFEADKKNHLTLVKRKPVPLTILSWGLGQESTDIAVRIVADKKWEKRFRHPDPEIDCHIITSDTGAEWPEEWEFASEFIEGYRQHFNINIR